MELDHVAYAQRDLLIAGSLLSVELACPDVMRRADAPSVSDAYVLEEMDFRMKKGLTLIALLLLPALSACPLDSLTGVLSDEECLDIIAEFADPLLPSQADLASIEGAEEICAALEDVQRGLSGGCCPHPWLDSQDGVEDSEALCTLLETQLVALTVACDATECFTDADCDDGVFCNGLEPCDQSSLQCMPAELPCQPDLFCDEATASCGECLTDPDCEDAEFCNGQERCDPQTLQCTAGTPACIAACDEETQACASTDALAVFVAPDSTFSTVDVRDVDEEVVRFDTMARSIIWAANGQAFQEGNWVVDGNFLGAMGMFQVRFGTVDGDQRAYFTETGPATICDIFVTDQGIRIVSTSVPVPGS